MGYLVRIKRRGFDEETIMRGGDMTIFRANLRDMEKGLPDYCAIDRIKTSSEFEQFLLDLDEEFRPKFKEAVGKKKFPVAVFSNDVELQAFGRDEIRDEIMCTLNALFKDHEYWRFEEYMSVRDVRRKLGFTQSELAEELGMSVTHIQRLEYREVPLQKQTALALERLMSIERDCPECRLEMPRID
jgi:DNA-binding XRE family transcriptional regulator